MSNRPAPYPADLARRIRPDAPLVAIVHRATGGGTGYVVWAHSTETGEAAHLISPITHKRAAMTTARRYNRSIWD